MTGQVPTPALRLNGAAVRARRLEMGLSERRLTALLGTAFSQSVVRSIESGTHSPDLTLGDIDRLVRVLAMPLVDLLVHRDDPDTTGGHEIGPTAISEHGSAGPTGSTLDAGAVLTALLLDTPSPVPLESPADTLELPVGDVERLLGELEPRLRALGLAWYRVGQSVKLRHNLPASQVHRLREHARRQVARAGLSISQVQLVAAVLRGRKLRTLTNNDQVAKGFLINAGLLAQNGAGGLELTEAVRFSLLLE